MPVPGWRLAALLTALLALGAAPALAEPTGATTSDGSAADRPADARSAPPTPFTATRPTRGHATTQKRTAQERATTTQVTSGRSSTRTERPARILPERVRGRAAVRALGTKLPAVARLNDLSSARLTTLLTTDHTAWISPTGRLFFQEDEVAETTTASTSAATVAPAYPTSETFTLHSRPGATRKIFLDFDGATVTNTEWNGTGPGEIANGTHTGFDTDGSPSTFSTSEHGFVQEVWRQVSETYSPFNVDVTTADPGVAGITRDSLADLRYGTQVLITSSSVPRQQVCGTCLGVAFVGTFGQVDSSARYQPAWVFAYDTGFDPMIVAQAASHETGHTLGLRHDGQGTYSYYAGTSAWGPVMGSSATRAVSQFSRGEYSGATNAEDDFAVIAAHSLPLRADDHGSSPGTADALGSHAAYDVDGVIETRTDTDVFALTMPCTSQLNVSATGIGAQSTLDLKLDVLDAAGNVVSMSSPTSGYAGSPPTSTGMNASVSLPVASGSYYLRVDGVGNGNPATTGWSDYGSLGQYHLSAGTLCQEPAPGETPPADPNPSPDPSTPPDPGSTPDPGSAPPSDPPANPAPAPQASRPSAPRIGLASRGARGGPRTAVARWAAPATDGGAAITRYRVIALRVDRQSRVVRSYVVSYQRATVRSTSLRLPRGRYVFRVMAWNKVGASPWSSASPAVAPR